MLKFNFELCKNDLNRVKKMPDMFKDALIRGIRKAMLFAEGKSKAIFAESGPVKPNILTARTGHLRRSIRSGVDLRKTEGWIGTNVVYGKIHEETGAGKAKILRPFLAPAMKDNEDKINNIIRDSVIKEFK